MKPLPILAAYHRQLERLDNTRTRMEALFGDGRLKLSDLHSVYESLFVRAVAGFETYCEDLFFQILNGRIEYSSRKTERKITSKSKTVLREILHQGKPYLDWLPFNKTIERVELYIFRRGNTPICGRPFIEVDQADKGQLTTILTIRHAIAHVSQHALKKFNDTVIGNQALLQSEKAPAGFLRSQIGNAPIQRRFEAYLGSLGSIATKVLGKPIP